MRYIVDESGYLKEVSFGAVIACGGQSCTAYTGSVPDGYSSLADWYCQENDKLYRWMIVDGELTLDDSAAEPEVEWTNPPMIADVEYRTTERWQGKPVYRKLVEYTAPDYIGNTSTYALIEIPHEISGLVQTISCKACVGSWHGLLPYVADGGGVTAVVGVDETNINLKIVKDRWNAPTIYFDLAYVKE